MAAMACSNVPTSRSIRVDAQALGHQDAEISSPGPRSPIGKSHILGSCLSGELASPFWNVTWRWINFVSDLQNYRCSSIFSIHHPFLGIFHITHSHQPMLCFMATADGAKPLHHPAALVASSTHPQHAQGDLPTSPAPRDILAPETAGIP